LTSFRDYYTIKYSKEVQIMISSSYDTPSYHKQLIKLYNDVNKSIYGFGTTETKIYFNDNLITFTVRHNRIPCLIALEKDYSAMKEWVDVSLMNVFKERFQKALADGLNITPQAILRDYDPKSLIAVTVVVLK